MDAVGDLLVRDRRSGDPALRAPGRDYDYRRLLSTAWKAGNVLRHHGVRRGRTVAVADDRVPEPLLAFLGAALLGAPVRFGPPPADARVAVVPRAREESVSLQPGGTVVVYGGQPAGDATIHFEADLWSENPAFPATDRAGGDAPALATAAGTVSQRALVGAGAAAADDWGLGPGDEVVVRAPLAHPGTVAAGVVAPLVAGAAVLLPGPDDAGDVAVAEGEAPEPRVRRPDDAVPG